MSFKIKDYIFKLKEVLKKSKKSKILVQERKVLHSNAFLVIQVYGLKGFPFTLTIESDLTLEESWVGPLVKHILKLKLDVLHLF